MVWVPAAWAARREGESDMQTPRHSFRMRPIAALATTLLALNALAAFDYRPPSEQRQPRTAGERVDSAVSRAEQKGGEIANDVKSGANKAAQSTEKAAAEVGDKVKDAAITTAVNAKLAADSRLSVLRINV